MPMADNRVSVYIPYEKVYSDRVYQHKQLRLQVKYIHNVSKIIMNFTLVFHNFNAITTKYRKAVY